MPDLDDWITQQIDAAFMQALHKAVDDTVNVIHASPPIRPGDWWYYDNGLPLPPPEPTPAERALAILAPHLDNLPLYRAGPV